jgi:drug/metabolite transporter (DMT)-like permease
VIFVYIMPFVVAVGAHLLLPNEKLTPIKLVGLLAAFGGLAFAFSDALSLPSRSELFGDLLCLAGAFFWGGTTLVIKKTKLIEASPEKVLLYQLAVSAVVLIVVAPLFGPLIREPTATTFVALGFQAVIVVSISYLVWFWLLRSYPAADLTTYTFLTPVFGLLCGAVFLHESIGPKLVIALALIAFGIWLVSQRRFGASWGAK